MILFCFLALAHAGILGTDFSPATAVSYSSIRLGSLSTKESPELNNYVINSPTYDIKNRAQEKQTDGIYQNFGTTNRGLETSSSNIYSVPTRKDPKFLRYTSISSRQLNLARPLPVSRNIPESPLPEFATAPTLLKTEGLSAYASIPLETVSNDDSSSYFSEDLPSSGSNTRAETQFYLDSPVESLLSQSEASLYRPLYDYDSNNGPTYFY